MTAPGPTYDLLLIQQLVRSRQYRPTSDALRGLGALGFDVSDLEECLLELEPGDFYKTMPSEKKPGLWQDVYRRCHCGQPVYLKVQVVKLKHGRSLAVIISFKRK